jgi:hypothetical protein
MWKGHLAIMITYVQEAYVHGHGKHAYSFI